MDSDDTARSTLDKAICDLFLDKAFVRPLVNAIELQRDELCSRYCKPDVHIDRDYRENDLANRLIVDREVFTSAPIKKLLSEKIDERFGKASPIIVEDAITVLFQQLAARPMKEEYGEGIHPEWLQSYQRAILFLATELDDNSDKRWGEIPINLGIFAPDSGFEDGSEGEVWEHEGNIGLYTFTEKTGDNDPSWLVEWPCHKVNAQIRAWGTKAAIGAIEEHLKDWAPTIADVIRASATDSERHATAVKPWLRTKLDKEFDDGIYGPRQAWVNYDCSVLLSHLDSPDSKAIANSCFSIIFAPGKHLLTDLEQRLFNAITLFKAGNEQNLAGVSIVMLLSAVEALVCDDENDSQEGVSKQVRTRVSALLLEKIEDRKKAEGTIGALYTIRSKVAHGEKVDAIDNDKEITKHVCAGVIRSTCSWINHQHRIGCETLSHKDFVTDIWACVRKGQKMVGVPDLSSLVPPKKSIG